MLKYHKIKLIKIIKMEKISNDNYNQNDKLLFLDILNLNLKKFKSR